MKKKLIEVALPLEAINKASAREKSIRHGHPSTLHLWWARRPLAAARAVIFAQMVDDPSAYVDVLRGDVKIKRKAEAMLKARRKTWQDAKALAERAVGTTANVPELGPEPTLDDALADVERERLFRIIEDLVQWENTTNEEVLQRARDEIWQSWRRACAENADHLRAKELFERKKLPAFHDPFAGGGALPLEAQRLGLEAYASDLNPVAVLINKAMIEIPPKFAGRPPVNPESVGAPSGAMIAAIAAPTLFAKEWKGAQGLAEDVRYYGKWMRNEAAKRIGHLYPKIEITRAMVDDPANPRPDLQPYVGQKLTVIAWLWARTVKSPNPAFADIDVPLASSFMLSTKPGKEAWVEPVILPSPDGRGAGGEGPGYRFTVRTVRGPPTGRLSEAPLPANGEAGGRPTLGPKDRADAGAPTDKEHIAAAKNGTKLARGANFQCVMSGTPIAGDYIKAEGKAGRMGARMMAIVAEGDRGRVYLAPTAEHEAIARSATPEWAPEGSMVEDARAFTPSLYGLTAWADLFTSRQLVALTTFSDLVQEARERVKRDSVDGSLLDNAQALRDTGNATTAYAEAVGMYLGLGVDKAIDYNTTLVAWSPTRDQAKSTFARQALPMVWDYTEVNPLARAAGDFSVSLEGGVRFLEAGAPACSGSALQADAAVQSFGFHKVVSTDPPYYDNVPYADLSDFFYIWLRRSLRSAFPELFATVAVPKAEELVATPYRHGSKKKAETFFLDGMTQAMHRIAEQAHPAFPVTIYYAFKQSETETEAGTASTGWETFLDAAIEAGFGISGTWPMRTEREARSRGIGSNALASSIVLVCRPRAANAPTTTRREFVAALKAELPVALAHLQRGNIAPVDLAQAAIGPGMAVYTRYSKVLGAEGKPLSVREALALINQTLDEALAEQEGDFDADTRWALAWFEQSGFDEGEFGVAEVLSKAKVTSVAGMVDAGILASNRGKVRLLRPDELRDGWNPSTDARLTVWEMVHHLVRALDRGEAVAADLVAQLGSKADTARELAYRLYTLCERKKRAAEALSYNALVQSWPELVRLARETASVTPAQGELL